jgi:hypothetical protein
MVHKQQVWKEIVHPLATVIGAWGGFPEPPAFFKRLAHNELFQYFLVFALVYQGGGSENIATSLMVTVGLYLVTKILNLRTLVGDLEDRARPVAQPALVKPAAPVMPPPTAAPPASHVPAPPVEGFYGGW